MSVSNRLIEQVLVLRCQIGDRSALVELIERYQAPLRYFVARLIEDPEMAEDILQDTWLAVIRKIHTLRQFDTFSTWLYRIARNSVYKELRKKKHLCLLAEDVAAPGDNEEPVFSPEDAARVHVCLERLRPEHKEVLMLRFLEQMLYEQISQVIGCKVGTVRSRIHYAKRALKREMET
ncbi:MAG TPA: sigma-70 family RNA polymerase sigma factor [Sedimentisphaerales bacterium]|nr:sigma-70 family RNA polymerase sigma factor [Sedimentisphaerales bacterium]